MAQLEAQLLDTEVDAAAFGYQEMMLADGTVHYLGQPVFAVIATTRELARRQDR